MAENRDEQLRSSAASQVARGALVLTFFQFASKPVLAIFFILLGNRALFTEAAYGRLEGLLALTNLFLIVSDLGLETYTTRRLVRDPLSSESWLPGQVLVKIFLTILSCFFLMVWLFVADWVRSEPLSYGVSLAAVILLMSLSAQSYLRGLSRGHQRMGIEGVMGVVEKAVTLLLGLIALLLGASLFSVLLAFALGSLAGAIYSAREVRRMEPGCLIRWRENPFSRPAVRTDKEFPPQRNGGEGASHSLAFWKRKRVGVRGGSLRVDWGVLSHSLPFALSAICISLFFNLDRVLLSFWSDFYVAPYARGLRIVWALLLFPQMMSIALYPALSRLRNHPEERLHVSRKSLQGILHIALPFTMGGLVLAGPLMDLLYGEAVGGTPTAALDRVLGRDSASGNETEAACLRILLLGLPFTCGNYLFGPALNALDRETLNLRASAIATVVSLFLNLALIPFFGPVGAALATTLTQGVYCLNLYRHLRASEASWLSGNRLPLILAMSSAMALVLLPIRDLPVLILVIIGGLAYAFATWLLGMWPHRFW